MDAGSALMRWSGFEPIESEVTMKVDECVPWGRHIFGLGLVAMTSVFVSCGDDDVMKGSVIIDCPSCDNFELGGVLVGQDVCLTRAVLNRGSAPLDVTTIEMSNEPSPFWVETLWPTKVAAGGELQLRVCFAPPVVGDFSDEVVIVNDSSNRKQYVVRVSGRGLDIAYVDGGVITIDGGVVPIDGGVVPLDGGVVLIDGGVAYVDGGVAYVDGGAEYIDGGVAYVDGGVEYVDGGVQYIDGGVMISDGGVVFIDGGVVPIDGGLVSIDGGVHYVDGGVQYIDGGVQYVDGGVQYVDGGTDCGDAGGTAISWTSRSSGTTNMLVGVTHGPRFVAVGMGGAIVTSLDGVTWASVPTGNVYDLYDVVYGAGRYVAVGAACATCSSVIRVSSDGLTWTGVTPVSSAGLNGIAYGPAGFVACGNSGMIQASTDGLTWTQRSSPSGSHLDGVSYVGGQYIVSGHDGTVLTSLDTVTWTAHNAPSTHIIEHVAYSGTTWVGVGYQPASGLATLLSSADLSTWTNRSPTGATNIVRRVIFERGVFLAAGSATGLLRSMDGLAWTPLLPSSVESVTSDGTTFIAVGGGGAIWSSP